MNTPNDVEQYIQNWPPKVQERLRKLQTIIQSEAPEAKQKISYGIPTFTYHGNLIHFGGAKNHIGLYPGAGPVELFKDRLTDYETSKGTIKLPLDQPLPIELIKELVASCVQRNLLASNKA